MKISRITIKNNLVFSFVSNILFILVSLILILVIPRFYGVREYALWQLYIFYSSYIGFFQLGWNDGVYLKHAGDDYYTLDKKQLASQIRAFSLIQIAFSILIIMFSFIFIEDESRNIILLLVSFNLLITNIKSIVGYLLQATNRIKIYSQINIFDRFSFLTLVTFSLIIGINNFLYLIIIDLVVKFISMLVTLYQCKDILSVKSDTKLGFIEGIKSIKIGIVLMLSNISSMLMIGVVKILIESQWGLETFGKISLVLSISNLLVIFLNSIAIVILPVLKNIDSQDLVRLYGNLKTIITSLIFGTMILYYPIVIFSSYWLPSYADSFYYMAMLLPITLFEGKQAMIINPYMKALRKEKYILAINLLILILNIILSLVSAYVIHSLELLILNILLSIMLRTTLTDLYLMRKFGINSKIDLIQETILVIVFVSSMWFIEGWISTGIYLVAYIIYIYIKKQNIIDSMKIFNLKRRK